MSLDCSRQTVNEHEMKCNKVCSSSFEQELVRPLGLVCTKLQETDGDDSNVSVQVITVMNDGCSVMILKTTCHCNGRCYPPLTQNVFQVHSNIRSMLIFF